MTTTIQFIDTSEELISLCEKIAICPWIALDTEFLREKSYYPQFCLLQIATPDWVACIDPLVLKDLTPLFNVIYNPKIIKVFHACRQDLEIFYQITGKIPAPIFDTQIAAPLLGIQENPGYAMLVSNFLNVNLSKTYTRTDWSLRPLQPEQLKYAADDVIYLCRIYQKMREQLTQLKRDDWLINDFKQLLNPDLYAVIPENAWLKFKGKQKLTGKQLAIIQALTNWREYTAQLQNKPRNWLVRDDVLLELAKLQPTNLAALKSIRTINSRLVQSYGVELCNLISTAQTSTPISLNASNISPKKTRQQEAVLDVLNSVVRVRAIENCINPVILASRKELENLIFSMETSILLTGWRYEMIGRELCALLNGELNITLNPEQVNINLSVFD